MKKLILCLFPVGLLLVACNGGGGGSSSSSPSAQAIPGAYQCYPSQLPTGLQSNSLQIAYAGNCSVESASQSANLQKMAVALERYQAAVTSGGISTESGFYNFCTGTPIKYNPTTGVTFIVTAAHCVTGTTARKPAGSPITAANISTYVNDNYDHNQAWIYQGLNAGSVQQSQLSGQILAVYVPSQYCQSEEFAKDNESSDNFECQKITQANGDFAILKVQAQSGLSINIASNLKLAPSNLVLTPTTPNGSATYLMALGYGGTNTDGKISSWDPMNSKLNYINYQYYATNLLGGSSYPITILNSYFSNNNYYALVCGGDSGGGDFAWDGSNWNLLGVHSWTSIGYYGDGKSFECGYYNANLSRAASGSADVRQFNGWIQGVLNGDNQTIGCANLGSTYVCASGTGK